MAVCCPLNGGERESCPHPVSLPTSRPNLLPFMRPIVYLVTVAFLVVGVYAQAMGDQRCTAGYCLTAVYDNATKNTNYTLLVPHSGPGSGWYSVVQSHQMAGATYMIGWINNDSTLTTSLRGATGNHQPLTSLAGQSQYVMNTAATKLAETTSGTVLSMSWLAPQSRAPGSGEAHSYGHSPVAPTSPAADATIHKHTMLDIFTLDMTRAFNASAAPTIESVAGMTAAVTSSSAPQRDLSNNTTRIFLVHMILMLVAWLLLAPLGALVARYGRTVFTWYPHHRNIQLSTVVLVIIGFALGVAGISSTGGTHLNETHHKVGLAIFILIFVQCALGVTAHWYRGKTGRRFLGYIHAPLGILLFGLAVWNMQTGFDLWEWRAGAAPRIVVWVVLGVVVVFYLAGFALLPREIRQQKERSQKS